MKLPTVLLVLAALLAVTGAASAHANYVTDDGKFRITYGNIGEPVYTYQKTGLDLTIRDNATGAEVPGVNASLDATLIAPGGETLECPLIVQHGAVGKYTCAKGYTLTQPGLYKLKLVGTINGTTVNNEYAGAHAIESQSDIMFPAKGLPTIEELDAKIKSIEAHLGEHDEAEASATQQNSVPGFEGLLAVGALAAVAVAVALRRKA